MTTATSSSTVQIQTRGTLPTGDDFLASLRDDRHVYIHGRRIDDVSEHPATRGSARSIARLYDAMHDPAHAADLLAPIDDAGPPGRTHAFFPVKRDRDGLMQAQSAIACWARLTYGWMGRTPDYKASLTSTFGACPGWYGKFEANARRWYTKAQRELPFIAHAIVNPPIDRHLPVEDTGDVAVRVVSESSAGIRVRGAKVVATSAALGNWVFVGQTPATASDDDSMAMMFLAPVAAEGVKIICRASYEQAAARHGGPTDYPLSSRFDENDAMLVFEDVLVPWENVLVHRDPKRVRSFFTGTGFVNNFLFHGCTRLAVKMEFMAGLLAKALRLTGGDEHRGNQAMLGEVVAYAHTFWSLSTAMASSPDAGGHDRYGDTPHVLPNRRAALAYSVLAPQAWSRVREIVQTSVASGLIYLPSSAADLANPEIDRLLAVYCRGSRGVGHAERIKVMKLLWDAVGSEFAGRHELYERNYAGSAEGVRLQAMGEAQRSGRLAAMEGLVDECLGDYDAAGWKPGAWR